MIVTDLLLEIFRAATFCDNQTVHELLPPLIQNIYANLNIPGPGGYQSAELVDLLDQKYAGQGLGYIFESLQNLGHQSPFFGGIHTDFLTLVGPEDQIKFEWEGKPEYDDWSSEWYSSSDSNSS